MARDGLQGRASSSASRGSRSSTSRMLRGREGIQFVEVDAHNRIVPNGRAREAVTPQEGPPLYTNIDLDLQEYIHSLFARHARRRPWSRWCRRRAKCSRFTARPRIDPNRLVGGVSHVVLRFAATPIRASRSTTRRSRAVQPPGSTFKLATAVDGARGQPDHFDTHMPQPCTGFYYFGNRAWHCWKKGRARQPQPAGAIAQSCDVYFYQLGPEAHAVATRRRRRRPRLRQADGHRPARREAVRSSRRAYPDYFNQKYGARGWTTGVERVEHGDRSGRERADGGQHGALLQRAGDGRQRADADDQARDAASVHEARFASPPDQMRAAAQSDDGRRFARAVRRRARRSRA